MNPIPRPVKNKVIVRQDPSQDKIGSFYVPQGSEVWPSVGTVEFVGPTVEELKVGDRVLFQRKPSSALCRDWREGDPEGWRDLVLLVEDLDIIGVVLEE